MDGSTFVWLIIGVAGAIAMLVLGFWSMEYADHEIRYTKIANFGTCVLLPAVISIIVTISYCIESSIGFTNILRLLVVSLLMFSGSFGVLFLCYFFAVMQQQHYCERKCQKDNYDHTPPDPR